MKFESLREKFKSFCYESFSIDGNKIIFHYRVEGEKNYSFTHYLEIPNFQYNKKLDNIIFNIGLVESISYYKIFSPKIFIIEAGYINEEQQNFFKKLFLNGLSEFIFVNKIELNEPLFEFKTTSNIRFSKEEFVVEESNLIPIGGGKDSIVTYELLKENSTLFAMNPIEATKKLITISKNRNVSIKRVLDKQIIELNQSGNFLNGHIPFSAVLSFITLLIAVLTKNRYIVLSNESSANEGNTIFNGLTINHQYSKSLEYENDFREYVKNFITPSVEYFSFLRPLHEIQIAKIFSSFNNEEYFSIFRSCNVGSKTGIWCCNCSKCLFVYIMFSPFLSQEKLTAIFGENLLNKLELKPIFEELTDYSKVKPLECVGSYDEVNFALSLTIDKLKDNLPILLKGYKKIEFHNDLLKDWNNNHNLPSQFEKILKKFI